MCRLEPERLVKSNINYEGELNLKSPDETS